MIDCSCHTGDISHCWKFLMCLTAFFGSVLVQIINSASYLFSLNFVESYFCLGTGDVVEKMWEKTNYHVRKILESCLVSWECLPGNAALFLPSAPWGGWKVESASAVWKLYITSIISPVHSSLWLVGTRCVTWSLFGGVNAKTVMK